MRRPFKPFFSPLLILCLTILGSSASSAEREVNIYSYRQPHLIAPMLAVFTKRTGIKVNTLYANSGVLERLRTEGVNSPADLVFTVDIGRLSDLKNAGLTQALDSAVLRRNLPQSVRDSANHWFGLTSRARILAVSNERVAKGEITRYEDLAEPKWRGRICTRSGKHPYNIALIAAMIHWHGEAHAEKWLSAVKANLARTPQGNDRSQVKAVAAGECDVAVLNHYYMDKMLQDPAQKSSAEAVRVIFPNQTGRGTHMNISGMAMTKHAPNRANARQLMEFLASEQAQQMYAEVNGEYPVNQKIGVSTYLKSLGKFKRDTSELSLIAAHRAAASKMVDRVGYND